MSEIPGGTEGDVGPVTNVDDATEVTRVNIKVNGLTIEVTEKVIVHEMLTRAKEAGCIEGEVDEYVIERVSGEGELSLRETIVVEDQEEFLAVPTGKTEVA